MTPSFVLHFRFLWWLKHHYRCNPPPMFTFVYHTLPDPLTYAWGGPSEGLGLGLFCVSTAGFKGTRLWITWWPVTLIFTWQELPFVYPTKVRLPSIDATRGSLIKTKVLVWPCRSEKVKGFIRKLNKIEYNHLSQLWLPRCGREVLANPHQIQDSEIRAQTSRRSSVPLLLSTKRSHMR